MRAVDLKAARLDGTLLGSADLTGARNVTPEQMGAALTDAQTQWPDGIGG